MKISQIFTYLFLLSLILWLPSAYAHYDLIIDTDVGIDDVIAMVYLLKHPTVQVKAITIEGNGNSHCKSAFANTQNLLHLLHQTAIPVACGQNHPLAGPPHPLPTYWTHLADTLAGTPLKKIAVPHTKQSAVDLLIKTLQTASKPLDILAIGPLTNLAQTLAKNPSLKNKIHRIYLMGGAIHVPGNVKTNHVAEWNIYFDPYAADQIFHSGISITLIPLDATNQVPLDTRFDARIQQYTSDSAQFILSLLSHNRKALSHEPWYFWDPLAAVVATHPDIASCHELALSIDLSLGATHIDKLHGNPIRVCFTIHSKQFKEILLNGLI